jgi:hypothetical protein
MTLYTYGGSPHEGATLPPLMRSERRNSFLTDLVSASKPRTNGEFTVPAAIGGCVTRTWSALVRESFSC